ncbi:hypothetical protein FUAX_45080 (plasmid) [Fulvitalea axinellae]|uniref:SUKH-4 immunity protein n=1 Tax=Fulvitalea axinellae TaxID=1182444 RepID=A0AAU9CSK0_9BACT|nr:hypothetical protein FUAX_45080 [Fulvitalea axinellae]
MIDAGVPQLFLDALKDIDKYDDLQFMIREPDSFYFYIDTIYNSYKSIKDFNIVPVFEGSNGDVFYVYLFNEQEKKFAHFTLENDELYSDYGTSFSLMLANLLIDLYEFAYELPIEELSKIGREIGAQFSDELFKKLEMAGEESLRKFFESDNNWRKKYLEEIIKSS